ncbi:hypothetical protein MRB53_020944 [Persea americana]|uniref:Uncharacterized protein n=1 Tax=Persea americana TaxID=3435 RepID=A0ACC2L2P0_PERAE|nr:hypothetical protein MRB53_020944 [Persea americana]
MPHQWKRVYEQKLVSEAVLRLRGLMADRKQRKSEGKRDTVGEGERATAALAPASLRETERQRRRSVGGVAGAAGDGGKARGRAAQSRAQEGKREEEGKKSGARWGLITGLLATACCGRNSGS